MAADLSLVTSYEALIAAKPSQKKELWSESVRIDARNKNVLKDFIGAEGSGKPIIDKRDLTAGGAQKVTFTTTAPVRMKGTMGEAELKSHTGTLVFGDWSVIVDLRRFAISHNQLLMYLRFNKNLTPKQLSYKLCTELWGRMEMDDIQIVMRNKALFATAPNVFYIGGGQTVDSVTIGDTFDTSTIEKSAMQLSGQGATPMGVDRDDAGYEVPRYTVFGPVKLLYPLENEQKFREAVLHASNRGADNMNWTGKYPKWKNNLIHRHEVILDSANARQGSPLQPIALLGAAIPSNAATEVTGGGSYNTAGTLTDLVLFDYFSYFPGYWWATHGSDSAPVDNNTYYAIIYNVSGADRGKYEIVSYAAAGNNGNKLTVIREIDTAGQKTALTAENRYSAVHPSGSWIIPCNSKGVPICYALHMGADALGMARGAIDAERIQHGDDFQNDSGQWHLDATGIQGIRGYSPLVDTIGRYPNYLLIAGAADYSELDLVDLST